MRDCECNISMGLRMPDRFREVSTYAHALLCAEVISKTFSIRRLQRCSFTILQSGLAYKVWLSEAFISVGQAHGIV